MSKLRDLRVSIEAHVHIILENVIEYFEKKEIGLYVCTENNPGDTTSLFYALMDNFDKVFLNIRIELMNVNGEWQIENITCEINKKYQKELIAILEKQKTKIRYFFGIDHIDYTILSDTYKNELMEPIVRQIKFDIIKIFYALKKTFKSMKFIEEINRTYDSLEDVVTLDAKLYRKRLLRKQKTFVIVIVKFIPMKKDPMKLLINPYGPIAFYYDSKFGEKIHRIVADEKPKLKTELKDKEFNYLPLS